MNIFRKLTENGTDINLDRFISIDISSLTSLGIDPLLAQHIAHLFIRDPVILFEENLHLDDTKDTDHFEVIKSM
jgi:glutamate--cysteine ligase catalytic subunit